MDIRTLVVIGFSISLIESLTILAVALYRRENALTLFAVGFGCSVVGGLLLLGQGTVTPWISVLFANLAIVVVDE